MQSKPAISLRRPPPPAAVEAFVNGRSDAQAPGRLAIVESDESSSERPDVQASERSNTQALEHSSTQASEHSNVQVPEQPDVRTLENLDAQAPGRSGDPAERSNARRTRRSGTRTSGRSDVRAVGLVERADGRQRRRLTIYLPVELAKRLVVHCAAGELEMSDVVTDAVERELARG